MDQLIPFMLKSLLLAGAALLFLRLLRGTSASARSAFAHIALFAMIAMPVADMVLPSFSIAIPVAALAVDAPVLHSALPMAQIAVPISREMPDSTPIVTAPLGLAESVDWTVLAYAVPTLCLLFLILLGTGRLFRLRSRAQLLADPVWLGALARVQARMGFKRCSALRVSDEIPSPISWGLIRPMILLDQQTRALDDRAEAIIAHESAHVLHFDWAKLMLARVATALYWFNPLVWLLAHEAHQLREEAADDAVLGTNIADTDYAELLVRTARAQIRRPTLASAGGVAHGVAPDQRSLTRRVRRVLDAGSARGPATLRLGIGMMVGTLGLALLLPALSFEASGPSMAAVAPRPTLVGTVMKAVTTASQQSARIVDNAIGLPSIAAEAKEPAANHATYVAAVVASGAPVADTPAPYYAALVPPPILPPMAAQDAAPFAAQIKSDASAGPSATVLLPGTEASLRRYIESLQKGQPNYEEMTPWLADGERQKLPEMLSLIKKLGALKSITLTRVVKGRDIYRVAFENGRAECSMAPLTPDGKVQSRILYQVRTLIALPGIKVQLATGPMVQPTDVLPGTEPSLRPMGKGSFEVMMPRLADIIGRPLEKLVFDFARHRNDNGVLSPEKCQVRQSSGDADVDLIPCQAVAYCAGQFRVFWPPLGQFDQCVKPRMEAMVEDIHDRRSRARDML